MRKRQFLVFLLCGFILLGGLSAHAKKGGALADDQVIRLHIIANSDSPEDQALKRQVRDQILNHFSDRFSNVSNIRDSQKIIQKSLKEIENIAAQEIERNGKQYPVIAQLGRYDFPTKVYGDQVYGAGTYEALKVIIGEGKGQNWWCVMFPPLCFVDVSHGTTSNESANMEVNFQPAQKMTGAEGFQYKSKIVEIWEDSKPQLAKVFSFLKDWK